MPQSLKDLISGIVNMGMMVLVMVLMQAMKPLISAEKPKKVERPKETKEIGV